jgi:outer membrane lipoprotein-sorting protein
MIALWFVAAACDPQAIAASLPKLERVHCSYTQVKQSKLFKKTLTSKGELWVAGGDLRFDTTAPSAGSFVVSGKTAKMKNGEQMDVLPIDKLPKVSAFLGAFSGLFVGRLGEIEKEFVLAAECSGAQNTLVLTPKSDAFSFLATIRLALAGGKLRTLELVEKSGDSSTITLERCDENVDPGVFELQ